MKLFFLMCVIWYIKECLSFKVKFVNCEQQGFHCQDSTIYQGAQDVTYQCPNDDLKGITIDFWVWELPENFIIGKLTLKQCHTLRLRLGCTMYSENVRVLHVHHITDLRIFPDELVCNPAAVIFEKVEFLRSIPKNAFFQTRLLCNLHYCFLNKFVLENIKIGVIETGALELIDHIQLFRMSNVVVHSVQVGGIKIICDKSASVYILNSFINNLEPYAIEVTGAKFTVTETAVSNVSFAGINATLDTFEFSSNLVTDISQGGLAITAQKVNIVRNTFHNVHFGAFQQIGPTRNTQNFVYNFVDNFLEYVDVGGLHPHMKLFQNVSLDLITFANNSFYCTCDGLAWMGSKIGFGIEFSKVKRFYESILDRTLNNTCIFDTNCILPLKAVIKIAPKGDCQILTKRDQNNFCESYEDNSSKSISNFLYLSLTSFVVTYYF